MTEFRPNGKNGAAPRRTDDAADTVAQGDWRRTSDCTLFAEPGRDDPESRTLREIFFQISPMINHT
jgi:hypothetical protein